MAGGRLVKPAARALLGKLRGKPAGLFVRGAEVRAGRELAGLGLATLTDNGAIRGMNSERWGLELTPAGQAYSETLPTIHVTKRERDYHAEIAGTGGKRWGCGRTTAEAIGDLVSAHADALGIKVVFPVPEAPPC